MDQRTKFTVEAFWDPEAQVWCSNSDIIGLVIETDTLDEFEEVLADAAFDLIVANHWGGGIDPTRSLQELMPTIVFKRPAEAA
ncbi:DUF1902 domain-containing protein [Parvularcula maris]|uniref:DUF1902 domain-containing protein n=1 Tax=Parvularcula maris TaxID=2965077 RepID=A0A9X2L6U5_9PROT|nr:DUF1902 domain-containing protein [Parvularcula maris]MCQ8184014.1 DUF1902 domain-containing protein [Parvularcula maris]